MYWLKNELIGVCARTLIGEDISEQLDIIPAKMQVLVHVRKKYACKQCEEGITTAPLPPQPIPKSNTSPGLLAHIAVSKYQDALPLHRQQAVLHRSGVEIPRNTLANWAGFCSCKTCISTVHGGHDQSRPFTPALA